MSNNDFEKSVPRTYQNELVKHAREQNAILAADTGTGKTLVSALVLKFTLAASRMNPNGSNELRKIAFFLAPKVPLVNQQRDFLKQNTTYEVRGYTGSAVDNWDRELWQKEFTEADILVMTPQILLNILIHAHWKIQQIAIIVFDEVHHCRGRSPEAQIMRDFYHRIEVQLRPKILGLTASPIFSIKNPRKALEDMEILCNSRVFVVQKEAEELKKYTFQAKDIIVDYPVTPTLFPSYPSPSLWADLHNQGLLPTDILYPDRKLLGDRNPWYKTTRMRYEAAFEALGPFGADLFIDVHLTDTVETMKENIENSSLPHRRPSEKLQNYLPKLSAALAVHRHRLSTDGPVLQETWLSPKVDHLRRMLLEHDANDFRGMIFVSQRQIASTLALMLPRFGLKYIQSGPLVGHGQNVRSEPMRIGMKGMTFVTQDKIVEDFRSGKLNLLISTSVGEEGLDFPLCSFVCRFDPPMTLPQYIQTRGRARMENSKFFIMLEAGASPERNRLAALQNSEPEVKTFLSHKMDRRNSKEEEDLAEISDPSEGRFSVPETGAVLMPGGAIQLLNNLCSLIRRDPHTPPLLPEYTEGFSVTVTLPSALPIPRDKLVIHGQPLCQTKKAAKRSAAFNAVLILYELGVFDDYLLPIRRGRGNMTEDIDGKPPIDVSYVEPIMDIHVCDAFGDVWQDSTEIFIHQLRVVGLGDMGLVSAVPLEPYEGNIWESQHHYVADVCSSSVLSLKGEERVQALQLMEDYTKKGIMYSVTRKGLNKHLSTFLVPLDASGLPDWNLMKLEMSSPQENDWRSIDLSKGAPKYVSWKDGTRVMKLLSVPLDKTIVDCLSQEPKLERRIENHKKFNPAYDPQQDIVIEGVLLLQTTSTEYMDPSYQKQSSFSQESRIFPGSLCNMVTFSEEHLLFFKLFPPFLRMLSDVHRAWEAQKSLKLPKVDTLLMVEALMLPSANASFSNQRLECLGDSFLKVATTIHAFNKFRHKHEGQLSHLRQNSVCNRYLLSRGHDIGLARYMTNEPNNHRTWRLSSDDSLLDDEGFFVKRSIPRRSVQDCVEALLGAALLSGGIQTGLEMGTALNLCFGGTTPWNLRYKPPSNTGNVFPFPGLEESLGYTFQNKAILIEAMTHPAFWSETTGSSYQRLEFLGDAILDLVVVDYFFRRYPKASPGKLTRARARCVCNPTLSAIGVKRLEIQKHLFCDILSLTREMNQTASQFAAMSFKEIIDSVWKLESPKVLSDVFEALIGAVMIDSGWDYEVTKNITLRLCQDALELVDPEMPSDPCGEFLMWVSRYGCTQVRFRKASSSEEVAPRKDQMFVVVHGTDVGSATFVPPRTSGVVSRAAASLAARELLEDEMSEFAFSKLCTCTKREKKEKCALYRAAGDLNVDEADVNEETIEGFAIAAQNVLREMKETVDEVGSQIDDEDDKGSGSDSEETVEDSIMAEV